MGKMKWNRCFSIYSMNFITLYPASLITKYCAARRHNSKEHCQSTSPGRPQPQVLCRGVGVVDLKPWQQDSPLGSYWSTWPKTAAQPAIFACKHRRVASVNNGWGFMTINATVADDCMKGQNVKKPDTWQTALKPDCPDEIRTNGHPKHRAEADVQKRIMGVKNKIVSRNFKTIFARFHSWNGRKWTL